MTPPSGCCSKNVLSTPRTKKVLPVADSPANAVILLLGTPPYIEPLNTAFIMYEPVSIEPEYSELFPPSSRMFALSNPLTKSFKKFTMYILHLTYHGIVRFLQVYLCRSI